MSRYFRPTGPAVEVSEGHLACGRPLPRGDRLQDVDGVGGLAHPHVAAVQPELDLTLRYQRFQVLSLRDAEGTKIAHNLRQ